MHDASVSRTERPSLDHGRSFLPRDFSFLAQDRACDVDEPAVILLDWSFCVWRKTDRLDDRPVLFGQPA
jgi:hypothetical protein